MADSALGDRGRLHSMGVILKLRQKSIPCLMSTCCGQLQLSEPITLICVIKLPVLKDVIKSPGDQYLSMTVFEFMMRLTELHETVFSSETWHYIKDLNFPFYNETTKVEVYFVTKNV